MEDSLKWLPDADSTVWKPLGEMMRNGLRVPSGYLVSHATTEERIRSAYEDMKVREKTHFVAVRGASHAVLNVIGPDALIHTFRRLSTQSPDSEILVQRMIHAMWCGKAAWHRKNLRISANEGMMLLDPDIYLVNGETGKCVKRTLAAKQRKMIRHVDGSAKVVVREGERAPIPAEHLSQIAELAVKAGKDIGWAVDDLDKVWLLSVN